MPEATLEPADMPEVPVGLSPLLVADLLDQAHDAIVVSDQFGVIAFWNAGAESLYGYTRSEVIGKVGAELLHTRFPEPFSQIMDTLRRTGVYEGELRHTTKDGAEVTVESRWIQRTIGGEPQLLGITRDITKRRAAEALAQEHREEAERANRAKTEFLSRMSHELRTPLTAVLGFGQLLEQGRGANDEGREFARLIVRAGKHMLDLINEMLDLARIEEGRMSLSLEPVRVGDVVADALSLVQSQADQRRVVIRSQLEEAGRHVMADRQRLRQVLVNLLSNAVKYNAEGGSVSIASQVDGEDLLLLVEDTGPGIDAEGQRLLFKPFERLGAEQTAVEGIGLGLAVSRGLVEAMGGSMGLRSEVGRGSVFWVRLPAADSPAEDRQGGGESPPAEVVDPTPEATVLYVEDNASNVTLMERMLRSRPGIRLIPASKGGLGIDLARRHRPDVVFLDLNLPDLSGSDVLAALRADPVTAGLYVVILSADAAGAQVGRLLDAGADAYLTKPFEVAQFHAVLDRALKGRATL